ncbi:MAG: DUF3604 domain-containing protein, partial [Deltaproteobacteria bacterium]|nr:DUF3604 domain-containing protein [Deltaproteobacteria bacterium]
MTSMRRRVRLASVLVALVGACGDDDGSPVEADAGAADEGPTDAAADALVDSDGAGDDAGADAGAAPPVVVVEESREACDDHNPLRNAYFGDLHVHTSYSFDARVFDVRATPSDAYAFARGGELDIPPYDEAGNPARTIRLARPLDFAAVTDHSEFFAETSICYDPASGVYDSPTCVDYRASSPVELDFRELTLSVGLLRPSRTRVCRSERELCDAQTLDTWQRTQAAAEEHYDRSSACSFTTFVAYEWSASPGGSNLHRNVIFRTASVPRVPTNYIAAPSPEALWDALESGCIDTGTPCDAIAIPHNSNLARGEMFDPIVASASPLTREEAERRASREPLVEITQHKGTSECLPPSLDPFSEDERCDFEQLVVSRCTGEPTDEPYCVQSCADGRPLGVGGCYWPGDFVRGALRSGLSELVRIGANPFRFGLVGSTDTHKASPGDTDERTWSGSIGYFDTDPRERLTFLTDRIPLSRLSAGGLAVVWAEENSRDSLFEAMRRRETYATSGSRIVVRFFGGWQLPDALCEQPDLVEVGYRDGVPMGADLRLRTEGDGAPTFVLSAL